MFGGLAMLHRSSDGQTLVISSQDGYCSIVAFSPGELGTPYHDQRAAHRHSSQQNAASLPTVHPGSAVPSPAKLAATATATEAASLPGLFAKSAPSSAAASQPAKHEREPAAPREAGEPAQSKPEDGVGAEDAAAGGEGEGEPPAKKQKKRVAPTLLKPL